MPASEPPYVIILAGGEGNRLAQLTRALYHTDLPKQFAVLAGERSLLQTTIERAAALTPLDRIMVVITAHHVALATAQLAPYPGVELVIQPRNLDTAPGMMLPLARVLARDRRARVVFLPSDHHVVHVAPIHEALHAAARGPLADRLALIGVAPVTAETDYGWIVRGAPILRSAAFEVSRFHEKPTAPEAERLWQASALWNTFIQTGSAAQLWALAARCLPRHAAVLGCYADAIDGADELAALDDAYRSMPAANFSHDVLSRAPQLAVLPVAGTGWSDLGSPARVFASLQGTDSYDRLVSRIRGEIDLAG
jgi:mannose-1-phosphate guanylyltransferase